MKLILTKAAADDLEAIGDYIATENPRRAWTFVNELRARCESLVEAPRAFPLVARYEAHGVRRRVHGHYLIFYRVEAEAIIVLHVLHGARDYSPLLFPDEEL